MRSRALVIGLVTAAWMFIVQAAAFAQGYPGGGNTPPPTVGGEKHFPGSDKLPRTGTDVLTIILIALMVLVIGFALHRLSRRATPSDN
ncbi:MAG: LPXTG cell wall anchor domain-containing protein [Actinomycetota bacterium]